MVSAESNSLSTKVCTWFYIPQVTNKVGILRPHSKPLSIDILYIDQCVIWINCLLAFLNKKFRKSFHFLTSPHFFWQQRAFSDVKVLIQVVNLSRYKQKWLRTMVCKGFFVKLHSQCFTSSALARVLLKYHNVQIYLYTTISKECLYHGYWKTCSCARNFWGLNVL